MIIIIIAFILKILDNSLSTLKTISLYKEKFFIGGIFNAFSCLFYLMAIVRITQDNDNTYSIIAMCVATFLGTYMPGVVMKKSERDKLYIYDITADSIENGTKFADKIRDRNIAIKTSISYDNNMNKVLSCKVYCMIKDESKAVVPLIPKSFKYHVYVPINE